jgi:hypothetical protein
LLQLVGVVCGVPRSAGGRARRRSQIELADAQAVAPRQIDEQALAALRPFGGRQFRQGPSSG